MLKTKRGNEADGEIGTNILGTFEHRIKDVWYKREEMKRACSHNGNSRESKGSYRRHLHHWSETSTE